jgi:hypothetical protein
MSATEWKMFLCCGVGLFFLVLCVQATESLQILAYCIVSVAFNLTGIHYANKAVREYMK